MITMKHFLSLLAFCALALGMQAQTANTSEACHGDHTVHASNSGFSPSHLTIHAGESVEFIAFNGTHSVDGITNVYTGEPFNNPQDFALPPAYSFWFFGACIGTVDFEVPGTYHYNSTTTGNAGSITVLGDEQPSNTVVDIVVNSPVHNLLEAAVIEADLAGALGGEGPFTVFAPTDDAFLALAGALDATAEDLLALPELADILLYHVVGATALSSDLADGQTIATLNGAEVTVTINDEGIFINDAQVTVADIVADNGVVHVIDAVLIPPVPTNTVVDVIVNSDVHNLLEAAVIEADLAGALSGEGPFTVFAPTDDAFLALAGALGATAEDLLALPELADILLYHVVGGTALSSDLADGQTIATLNGAEVTVSIECDGSIFINDAQVVLADIVADNGVVHVIDAVLTPPAPGAACEDGGCCGEGTVWDPATQTCIADDGCDGDMTDDGYISIGDILIMLGVFGNDCD